MSNGIVNLKLLYLTAHESHWQPPRGTGSGTGSEWQWPDSAFRFKAEPSTGRLATDYRVSHSVVNQCRQCQSMSPFPMRTESPMSDSSLTLTDDSVIQMFTAAVTVRSVSCRAVRLRLNTTAAGRARRPGSGQSAAGGLDLVGWWLVQPLGSGSSATEVTVRWRGSKGLH